MHFRLENGTFQYRNDTFFLWAYNSGRGNVLISVILRGVRVVIVGVEEQ